MPPSPDESPKLSIEEMMERLSSDPQQSLTEGELVTRADGSQAIRVRKRKRRSEQPQKLADKRKQKIRNIQIAAFVLVIFVISLALGGALVYSNSVPFRDSLTSKIGKNTGSTVKLERFRINPKTANFGKLSMEWPTGFIVKSLIINDLQATISPTSLLGGSFHGDEITATKGTMEIQLLSKDDDSSEVENKPSKKEIQFDRYRISNFTLNLGDPSDPTFSLMNSEASLNPIGISKVPQVSLYKGDLTMTGWPKLKLDRALIELRGREIEILRLNLMSSSSAKGQMNLSGTINPYKPDSTSTLAVTLNAFEISGIAGPAFGRIISGKIDTQQSSKSNFLSFMPNQTSSPLLDIMFQADPSSTIQLRGLPFLFALSSIFEDSWFESPAFEADATGLITRGNGTTSLKNLNLESKSRMALRGTISCDPDQKITGTLQVGLAEGMIHTSKAPRLSQIFGPLRDGYRWVKIFVYGTPDSIQDNFDELLTGAANGNNPADENKNTAPAKFRELTE
jgi:hypothetical protein